MTACDRCLRRGVLLGLLAGFLTDAIVTAAGV